MTAEEIIKAAYCVLVVIGCVAAWIVHVWESRRNSRELPLVIFSITIRQEQPGLWVARSRVTPMFALSAPTLDQIHKAALQEGPRLAVFYGAATFGQRVRVLLVVCV